MFAGSDRGPVVTRVNNGEPIVIAQGSYLIEMKRGAPVTPEELDGLRDVYVRSGGHKVTSFVPGFALAYRLFAERMNGSPKDLGAAFENDLALSSSQTALAEQYRYLAENLEMAARTQMPAQAHATGRVAFQMRRAAATIVESYISEDALASLKRIAIWIEGRDSLVRQTASNLLTALPANENGLFEFPLFIWSLTKSFFDGEDLMKWSKLLKEKVDGMIRFPAFGQGAKPSYGPQAAGQLDALAEELLNESFGGYLPAIQAIRILIERGDVLLARDFIKTFIDLEPMIPSTLRNYLYAALYIAASRENLSGNRAALVHSVLRLLGLSSTITNASFRNGILPLAIAYLRSSDTRPQVDTDLNTLLGRLFMPEFHEPDGIRHDLDGYYDMNNARTDEMSLASDIDSLVYHVLDNLIHNLAVTNSIAAQLLSMARRRDLNGARIWLMSEVLDMDLLRGTGNFDPKVFKKYLAPLMDDDPKVQDFINIARLRRGSLNDDFFNTYRTIVRERKNRSGGRGGTSRATVEDPAAPAEGNPESTVTGLAETGESSGTASNGAPVRATRQARRSSVQHRRTGLLEAGAAVQRGALRAFGVPFVRTPVRTPVR